MGKINLKFSSRNIPLGEAFCFEKNARAICSIDVLFNIIEEAVEENIESYMLVYVYCGKVYSLGYDRQKDGFFYHLGFMDGGTKDFFKLEDLQTEESIRNIRGDVTVCREFLSGMGDVVEVPISSNVLLKNYLKKPGEAGYDLHITEEVQAFFPKTGVGTGIKNVVIFIGIILLVSIIFGILQVVLFS